MRYWNGRVNDDGSVHCLGNGRMCAYEQGPDIIQLFGPPYSSPSIMKILFDESLCTESERLTGTTIWKHSIKNGDAAVGEMTDFIDSEVECFTRKIEAKTSIKLKIEVIKDVILLDNSKQFNNKGFSFGLLLYTPAGQKIYSDYPFPRKIYFQLVMSGDIESVVVGEESVDLTVGSGTAEIFIAGGKNYGEVRLNIDSIISAGYQGMLARTKDWWCKFTGIRYDFEAEISKAAPLLGEFLDIADSVSTLIKAQQADEGGVLAGYNYRLGYVRDQYGVFRCLLKLGYFESARMIIKFYWNVWKGFGRIQNAQCMGVPGIFHVHENDEVEITGYLIIQAFNYLKSTSDNAFIKEILPMLEWAFEVQKKNLVNGMLPFNGDETYVPGGMLPRNALIDGSAEATMLFIAGGEKLLNWIETHSIWEKEKLEQNKELMLDVKNQFRDNFFKDGKLATNNPSRKKEADLPRFRHGVCESCAKSPGTVRPFVFGWTEKNSNNRYLCPKCMVNNNLGPEEDQVYYLQSVSLMPIYVGADLFSKEEISAMMKSIINSYLATGRLPSRPDGNLTVGYDYGLLLYNLTELEHPLAEEIYRKMMSVVDPTGAWVEYYENGKPNKTRCRPWESGINLEAAIHFMQRKYKIDAPVLGN